MDGLMGHVILKICFSYWLMNKALLANRIGVTGRQGGWYDMEEKSQDVGN